MKRAAGWKQKAFSFYYVYTYISPSRIVKSYWTITIVILLIKKQRRDVACLSLSLPGRGITGRIHSLGRMKGTKTGESYTSVTSEG